MRKGHIFVISGPSGVGKGTVVKKLLEENHNFHFSVSATTRKIRPNEIDGVHYYFISKEKFEKLIAEDALIEYANYANNYYGTPSKPVDAALEKGLDVLLEIEVQGALQIKKRRPDAILIFIAAPSLKELERRLTGRGDTDPEAAKLRLQIARKEYVQADAYDYIVMNDTVENACREVQAIVSAVECEAKNRYDILKEEL